MMKERLSHENNESDPHRWGLELSGEPGPSDDAAGDGDARRAQAHRNVERPRYDDRADGVILTSPGLGPLDHSRETLRFLAKRKVKQTLTFIPTIFHLPDTTEL